MAAETHKTCTSTTLPRRRPQYPTASMDLTRFQDSTHTHDLTQGLSRVVMVRKMEQRIFVNSCKSGRQQPQVETLTKETVQTFRSGNRTERKVTTSQKKDISDEFGGSQEFITLSRSASSSPELMCSLKQRSGTSSAGGRKTPNLLYSGAKSPKRCDIETSTFVQQCLQAHNEYRSKHNVPPLTLNKKLCRYSEEWAKHLVVRGSLEHRQSCPYGENLFCCWSSIPNYTVDGREPVDSWYQEKQYHPFGKEPSSLKSGHFTQVVWMSSRELGIGIARSRNGQIFVVANYDPPGNFLGQFRENVPPTGGFPSNGESSASGSTWCVAASEYTAERYLEDMLKCHNEYRKKHKAPALVLNQELCKKAQDWAKVLARDDKLMHRPDCSLGENLFSVWSSNLITARDACVRWYQEGKDYNYSLEPKILKCAHFTQMVWKGTKEAGFGMAKGRNGRVVMVANYQPAGNVIGQFGDNVLPPS
ncbi:uncharacterized protein LOC135843721 isoform X2 [Planococcus citri]|uniref:uncharacterized protein LOC135843721 isoform X2 n=1 Tax=Planococcus citri TaxID=170843 RepID=UPI0031F818AE